MVAKLNYSFGSISQLGKEKEFNTDSIIDFAIQDGHVFLLCDGHDGNEGHGALAAKLTAESIKKYFFNRTYKNLLAALTNAVTFANFSVHEQSLKDAKYNNIGATLAILIYKNNKVYYAYAGDSRIYLYKNQALKALTLDHVADRYNPAGSDVNVLVGRNRDIKFGVCKSPLEITVGDKILLCTDGLSDVVIKEDIAEVLQDDDTSPDHKAMLLAKKADENDGADNTSVYVVEFDNNIPVPKAKKNISKLLKTGVLAILVAGILGFGGFKAYEFFTNRDNSKIEKEALVMQEAEKPIVKESVVKDSVTVLAKAKIEKELAVKKSETVKKKTPSHTNTNQNSLFEHKIKFGENLYRLSLRYGISQQQLININGNKAKNLIAGSIIKIPVKAVHIVAKGESYSFISDKYNVKIDVICRANKLDKNQALSEGKKIAIPKK